MRAGCAKSDIVESQLATSLEGPALQLPKTRGRRAVAV